MRAKWNRRREKEKAVMQKKSEINLLFDDPDCFSRSRAQAIADGGLVDVTKMAREAGFRHGVAVTASVWSRCVRVPEGVECQDEAGRLWDILWMLRHAVQREKDDATELLFQLYVRNDNHWPRLVTLKAVCGPDEHGEPCITVMPLPAQD
jgi:hypothetical protein